MEGHPLDQANANSWTFLNQMIQVLKAMAPKFFQRFEDVGTIGVVEMRKNATMLPAETTQH